MARKTLSKIPHLVFLKWRRLIRLIRLIANITLYINHHGAMFFERKFKFLFSFL